MYWYPLQSFVILWFAPPFTQNKRYQNLVPSSYQKSIGTSDTKIGTLIPKIDRTRYQIDWFWYLELPLFDIWLPMLFWYFRGTKFWSLSFWVLPYWVPVPRGVISSDCIVRREPKVWHLISSHHMLFICHNERFVILEGWNTLPSSHVITFLWLQFSYW